MYCITFPGGCYGNFVAWTLHWLQGQYPLEYRPFNKNTNTSHSWDNTHRINVDGAISNPIDCCILHPITEVGDTMKKAYERLFVVYDKIVSLYPGPNDWVWWLNNRQTKIRKEGWIQHENQKNGLPGLSEWKGKGKSTWELREFLSLWTYEQTQSQTGYKELINLKQDKTFLIQINELRDNFLQTINNLTDWLDIKNIRTDSEIKLLHKDWINNEPYLYKDRLINSYVDAIIKDVNIVMENCTLMDQVEIQRRLRDRGYEIKCYELNKWPKTTTQLRKLIYEY